MHQATLYPNIQNKLKTTVKWKGLSRLVFDRAKTNNYIGIEFE